MEYKYAEKKNYEDYASGRVFYNQNGSTSFPARLASEIFCRIMVYLMEKNINPPYTIFDPCCGGGYLVATLALMHRNEISTILATDIDSDAIGLAKRNLGLLTVSGLKNRIDHLSKLYNSLQKISHLDAIASAKRLLEMVNNNPEIEIQCFQADILSFRQEMDLSNINIVIVDVPYGNIVKWHTIENEVENIFLNNLEKITPKKAIIAIISNKKQKFASSSYKRLEHFKVGFRQVSIMARLDTEE